MNQHIIDTMYSIVGIGIIGIVIGVGIVGSIKMYKDINKIKDNQ